MLRFGLGARLYMHLQRLGSQSAFYTENPDQTKLVKDIVMRFHNPHHSDADPDTDPNFYLMQIRLQHCTLMRIRIRILAFKIKAQALEKVLK